jgi:hypothetical protein
VEIRMAFEGARTVGLAESYHGHQGILAFMRDLRQDMADLRFEPEQVIDLGDRVAVRVTVVAVGRSAGVASARLGGTSSTTPRAD